MSYNQSPEPGRTDIAQLVCILASWTSLVMVQGFAVWPSQNQHDGAGRPLCRTLRCSERLSGFIGHMYLFRGRLWLLACYVVELSRCDGNHMALKVENIYHLALYRKSGPTTPDLAKWWPGLGGQC